MWQWWQATIFFLVHIDQVQNIAEMKAFIAILQKRISYDKIK